MMIRALIKNGLVDNMVLWDGVTEWTPPEGVTMVSNPPAGVGIGWAYSGGTFTAPTPPPAPVPAEVPQWQARRALHAAGLLTAVEAAVAASSEDVKITWEYAPNIRRDSPMIAALAPVLGLTDAQLDDLFRAAAAIT